MAETKVGEVYFDVTARLDQLEKGLAQARLRLESVGKQAKGASDSIAVGFLKSQVVLEAASRAFRFLSDTMQKSVKAASNLQETEQKFGVVYQNNIKLANQYAKTLQEGYGLSENAAKSMLAHTGDILQGFGMQEKAALDLSMEVQKLTVDLVSFTNYHGTMEEASRTITKAMLGEAEALESLGKKILDDDVKRRAQADGYKLVNGQLDNQARAITVMKLLTEQSKNAIGDFQRSIDSYANTMRIVDARMEDISAEIGKELIPSLANLARAFLDGDSSTNPFIAALKKAAQFAALVADGMTAVVLKMNMLQSNMAAEDKQKRINALLVEQRDLIGQSSAAWGLQGKSTADVLSKMKEEDEIIKRQGSKRTSAYQAYRNIQAEINKLSSDQVDLADKQIQREENLNKTLRKIQDIEQQTAQETVANQKKIETAKKQATVQVSAEQMAKMREQYNEWLIYYNLTKDEELARLEIGYQKEVEGFKALLAAKIMDHTEYALAIEDLSARHNKKLEQIEAERAAQSRQALLSGLSGAQGLINEYSSTIAQAAQNSITIIDQEQQARIDEISNEYETQKANIEKTITDKEKRDAALKALDEKRARDEKQATEKAEKDKRLLQHEAAKKQKELSRYAILLSIPESAQRAYNSMVGIPFVGPALAALAAAAATALGFERLRLNEQTPLPALAEGGYVPSVKNGTVALLGEGKSDEVVLPLTGGVFDELAERIVAAMQERASVTNIKQTVVNQAQRETIGTEERVVVVGGDINLDGEKVGEWISKGTQDARILISGRAVI